MFEYYQIRIWYNFPEFHAVKNGSSNSKVCRLLALNQTDTHYNKLGYFDDFVLALWNRDMFKLQIQDTLELIIKLFRLTKRSFGA